MGQHPPHAGAHQGAHTILLPHESEELQSIPADDGAQRKTLRTTPSSRLRRQHRLLPRQLHPPPKPDLRLHKARRWQHSRNRVERSSLRRRTPPATEPKSGWLYNSNNWPWSGAGESSLHKEDYPAYVETGTETARGPARHPSPSGQEGLHARLSHRRSIRQLPPLVRQDDPCSGKRLERPPSLDPLKFKLADEIGLLYGWDHRWAVDSVPPPSPSSGAKTFAATPSTTPESQESWSRSTSPPRLLPIASSNRSTQPPTDSSPTSEHGRPRGETSTATSASPATSSNPSTTLRQASQLVSPHRCGVRLPRSERDPTLERKSGTAPAETASSP